MKRTTPFLLLLAFLLSPSSSQATVVLDLPIPDLARRASLVVRATVERQYVERDEAHRAIVTRTVLRVTEHWYGISTTEITITQPGGELGRKGMLVAGAARFQPGEDVVVFLEPHRHRAGEYTLISLSASKFSVQGATATRDLSGLSFASPDPTVRSVDDAEPTTFSLDALREAVRAASSP